ncbi:MAG: hypothetical protein CMP86_08730 [Gammaproteobacteria bacterium]|nr:hypothetical protein [Gammaproteobacteria bacterium]
MARDPNIRCFQQSPKINAFATLSNDGSTLVPKSFCALSARSNLAHRFRNAEPNPTKCRFEIGHRGESKLLRSSFVQFSVRKSTTSTMRTQFFLKLCLNKRLILIVTENRRSAFFTTRFMEVLAGSWVNH